MHYKQQKHTCKSQAQKTVQINLFTCRVHTHTCQLRMAITVKLFLTYHSSSPKQNTVCLEFGRHKSYTQWKDYSPSKCKSNRKQFYYEPSTCNISTEHYSVESKSCTVILPQPVILTSHNIRLWRTSYWILYPTPDCTYYPTNINRNIQPGSNVVFRWWFSVNPFSYNVPSQVNRQHLTILTMDSIILSFNAKVSPCFS